MEPIRSLVLEDLDKVGRFLSPGDPGQEPTPLTELTQLARVNIFVGANNSGKSRLLRHLAASGRFLVRVPAADQERFDSLESGLRTAAESLVAAGVNKFGKHNLPVFLLGGVPRYCILGSDSLAGVREFSNQLTRLSEHSAASYHLFDSSGTLTSLGRETREKLAGLGLAAEALLRGLPPRAGAAPKVVYVPVLRGTRSLTLGAPEDAYRHRTEQDYFKREGECFSPEIVTGAMLFRELRRLRAATQRDLKTIHDYEEFLSTEFFGRDPVTLLSRSETDNLYLKIGHEPDRPIFDLGDGIQQAIILTFLAFTRQEPTFFFIEEPEVHMHPGLQRKLLDFYSQHEACKRHNFFLTTHSNHLLDMTADFDEVSVINFRKRIPPMGGDEREPEFLVEPVEGGDERSLQLLGVRNSSVFLVNATIWVEGITDRLYLRRFLDLYEKKHPNDHKLQEDVHYSIVEYGGSNITHWSWLQEGGTPSITVERLCGRVFLLADQDGADKKLERKEQLTAKLGDRFAVIPGREIENLLPRSVIRAVVLEHEKSEANLHPLDKMPEHKDEPLGSYIENKLLVGPRQRKGSYAEGKSGRLDDKVAFANKALKYLTDYDELSAETKGLIERIRSFVRNQNS